MPRKTKKSAEAAPVEPEIAAETSKQVAKAALDGEVLAVPKASSRPIPVESDGEAEASAQAADTFDEAFEGNPAATDRTVAPAGKQSDVPEEDEDLDLDEEPDSEEDDTAEDEEEEEEDEELPPAPPAKLERLQKILAQAGVASRRHAEELITEGRVQVNGQTVTELGTKADPNRDHIRVDGKLLQGAERHRYFVLNKPRGYVTTVSDPEGRPTVMEFFKKSSERLYPVGRLDYLSEGLLVVTNDGELANKLTRAASGVEKTYLVKVSGVPTDEEIEALREGVSIDRGRPGEGRVRTAPVMIRMVRSGDNPWFEVILTEGRNRELRKMFEEVGHHVEKIRRVGYGPLVLDQEPGNMRELDPEEIELLRRAADGKWKPKRLKTAAMLPKEAGRSVEHEADKRRGGKGFKGRSDRGEDRGERRGPARGPARGFERGPAREMRPERRGPAGEERPERRTTGFNAGSTGRSTGRTFGRGPAERPRQPERGAGRREDEGRSFGRPPQTRGGSGQRFGRTDSEGAASHRPARPQEARGGSGAGRFGRPQENRTGAGRSFSDRPERPARRFGAEEEGRRGAARSFGRGDSDQERRPPRRFEGEREQGSAPRRGSETRPPRPYRERGGEEDRAARFDRPAAGNRPRRLHIEEEGPGDFERRPARPRTERPPVERGRERAQEPAQKPMKDRPFRRGPAGEDRPRSAPARNRGEAGSGPKRTGGFGGGQRAGRPSGQGRPGGGPAASGGANRRAGTGPRPGGSRSSGPRPGGARPGGARPGGARPSGPRTGGSRPGGSRPGGPRPGGGSRPSGGGGRSGGPRPGGKKRT